MKRIGLLLALAVLSAASQARVQGADKALRSPVYLPILTYRLLWPDSTKRSDDIITPDDFENDLKLLRKHGYTTVNVKDLIDYVYEKKPLPEKPVMLTFDDGYESDYTYAFPLLKAYGMNAVFSVIGLYADLYSGDMGNQIRYARLNWAQIKEMSESGLAEFQGQGYDRHNPEKCRDAIRKRDESVNEYEQAVAGDFARLNQKFNSQTGQTLTAFTCPNGRYNDDLKRAAKRFGYSAVLTSDRQVNVLTGDPEALYSLGRFVRSHTMDLEKQIQAWESGRDSS